MDPLLQRRIQRYGWDKAASYYELYWQQQLEPAQSKLLEMVSLQPGEAVMDIACGSGSLTFRIAKSVKPNGKILATDISENMITHAAQAAAKIELNNLVFKRMDAEDLEIEDELYDVAICSLGLMYVPDTLKAVKEIHRVLKPGGRAAVLVWGQRNRCGWAEIFPIVESRVKSEVCPLFFQLGSGGTLKNTFEGTGFTRINVERFSSPLHYESGEEACGAAFAGGPVALAYSRFTDKMKTEAHADYLDSLANYKNGEGYDVPGEFVIAIGHKI
jgi:ubiquinone/menaquinone biosynthesis C-methylase UbiE